MQDQVAVVARDGATRARIAGYVADAGFAIEVFPETPPIAGATTHAVWVVDREVEATTVSDLIRPWLVARASRRAVILTWRPISVWESLDLDRGRLEVLVPPVFPWQIVDALRGWR